MNKEVGVRITVGTAGLQNVDKLVRVLKDAGAETGEFEQDAKDLGAELQRLGREQALIDQFVKLKREGAEAGKALREAQTSTRELAIEFGRLEAPTKAQTAAFEKSKTAARDAAKAVQDNKLALQTARGALTEAGIAADQLAAAQVRLNTQTETAQQRAKNLGAELQRQATAHKQAAAAAAEAGDKQAAAAKKAEAANKDLQKSVGGIGAEFTKLGGLAAGAFTGRELIQTAIQAESLQRGLAAVLGSSEAAAREFDYLKKTSNELGLELLSTGRAYLNLAASTQGTKLEGQATRDIFEAVSRAMSTLGKSSAETENALRAVGQMASKGTVSMEELRGQLGEALPGALKAAADGMGVTVQQLVEMVSSGDVLASDLLPRLADGLNKVYANGSPPDGMIANWNRLKNTISETVLVIGENGMGKALSTLAGTAAVAIGAISEAFVNVGKDIGEFAGAVATGNFELGTQAERIAESEKRLKGLSQTAGLTAPDALGKLEDGAKNAGNAVAGLGDNVVKSAKSYGDLLKAVDDAQQKVSDLSRQFVQERATATQVQEATEKLTQTKKDLTEASDKQQKASDLVVKGLQAESNLAVKLLDLERTKLTVKRDELLALGRVDEAKKVSIQIADLELQATERATLGKRQEANEIIRRETLTQQQLRTANALTPQIEAESNLRILNARSTLAEADAANVNSEAKRKQAEKTKTATDALGGNSAGTQTNTNLTNSNSQALETNAQRRERVIKLIDDQAAANRRLEGLSTIRQAGDPGNRLAADGGDNLSVLGPSKIGQPDYSAGGQVGRPNAPGNWEFDAAAYAAAGYPSNPDMARAFWRRTDLPQSGNGVGPFGGGRPLPAGGTASTSGGGYTITFNIGGRSQTVTAGSRSQAEQLVRDLEAAYRAAGGG